MSTLNVENTSGSAVFAAMLKNIKQNPDNINDIMTPEGIGSIFASYSINKVINVDQILFEIMHQMQKNGIAIEIQLAILTKLRDYCHDQQSTEFYTILKTNINQKIAILQQLQPRQIEPAFTFDAINALCKLLDQYAAERQAYEANLYRFGWLRFWKAGIKKEAKLQAVENLKKLLHGEEGASLTDKDVEALRDGRLGSRLREFIRHTFDHTPRQNAHNILGKNKTGFRVDPKQALTLSVFLTNLQGNAVQTELRDINTLFTDTPSSEPHTPPDLKDSDTVYL